MLGFTTAEMKDFPSAPEGSVSYQEIIQVVEGELAGKPRRWGEIVLQREGSRMFTYVEVDALPGAELYGIRASYDGSYAIEVTPGTQFHIDEGRPPVLGFMPARPDQRLKNTRHVLAKVQDGALIDIFRAALARQSLWQIGLDAANRQPIKGFLGAALILAMVDIGFPSTKVSRVRALWKEQQGHLKYRTVTGLLEALLAANSERGPTVKIPGQWEVPRDFTEVLLNHHVPVRWE